MKIGELRGAKIKKALGAERVVKRYHNKNKGWGNFGFTIVLNEQWYSMDGIYKGDEVTSLSIGKFSGGERVKLPTGNYDEFISALKEYFKGV